MTLSAAIKGEADEGLLGRNAQDTKSGAGQYLTTRPLINAITSATRPRTAPTSCNWWCGSVP
jgi:type I restriction-modification system DNA methylase subunit